MKTSWVLTEDDKSKVAASRRPPPAASVTDQEELAFKPGPGDLGNISIKTEAGEAEGGLGGIEHGLLTVKQRRPSSPMTPAQFRPVSSQLFPGPGNSSDSQICSSSGETERNYKSIYRFSLTPTYFRSFTAVSISVPWTVHWAGLQLPHAPGGVHHVGNVSISGSGLLNEHNAPDVALG